MSLRRLDVERIDLFQLHRVDPRVPADEQFGLLAELQSEGKVGAVGLSEVVVDQIERARALVDVATVQNRYNLLDRASDDVLRYCTEQGIGFLPWFPIASGRLAEPGGPVAEAAQRFGVTAPAVAVAWLLQRSSVMLPIPGTSSVAHLEENLRAATVAAGPGDGGEARRFRLGASSVRVNDLADALASGRETDLAGVELPAAELVALLTASAPPGAPALRLRRATITGALRLSGARVGVPVELRECTFAHVPDLRMAELAGLALTGLAAARPAGGQPARGRRPPPRRRLRRRAAPSTSPTPRSAAPCDSRPDGCARAPRPTGSWSRAPATPDGSAPTTRCGCPARGSPATSTWRVPC